MRYNPAAALERCPIEALDRLAAPAAACGSMDEFRDTVLAAAPVS